MGVRVKGGCESNYVGERGMTWGSAVSGGCVREKEVKRTSGRQTYIQLEDEREGRFSME